jgi:hypothetical protein
MLGSFNPSAELKLRAVSEKVTACFGFLREQFISTGTIAEVHLFRSKAEELVQVRILKKIHAFMPLNLLTIRCQFSSQGGHFSGDEE